MTDSTICGIWTGKEKYSTGRIKLGYQRYYDKTKLITDINKLQLTNKTEVVIYREEQWHDEIVVDLEGQTDKYYIC